MDIAHVIFILMITLITLIFLTDADIQVYRACVANDTIRQNPHLRHYVRTLIALIALIALIMHIIFSHL